ncbi:MAG: hypothetical protein NC394_05620 [Bacteroides sp.]|nr:hypothetical protein [Bacteroides sp.]
MNVYFHAYTEKYIKRRTRAIVLTVTPLAQFCMMIIWALMFNMKLAADPNFLFSCAAAVGASVLAGMALCLIYCAVCDRCIRTNRRYTYFEVLRRAAVFSKYKGSYTLSGKRTVLREVCVIPLKNYDRAYLDERKKHLILIGEIRIYQGESNALGYHVKDGFPVFDKWWYNEAEKSYKKEGVLRLPMDFEHPGRIAAALDAAKREFEKIPPKKEYVFKEADIVRKRRELKRLAEAARYSVYR